MPHTTSIPAAAYAKAVGDLKPPTIEATRQDQFRFIFEEPEADELFDEYFGGREVPARVFYCAVQDLKHRMRAVRGGGVR
jgi:hypothetical protein